MSSRQRATFDAFELAVVLSHYDLGVIESVTEFARGSRRSPKVGIVAKGGKFLLKRRSLQQADPQRVRFTHIVQKHLCATGFPAPSLITTTDTSLDMLLLREHLYEIFEFVPGHQFDQSTEETLGAGVVLARFHQATETLKFSGDGSAWRGDYHNSTSVRSGLCSIGSTLSSHDSFTGDEAELATLVQYLLSAYDQAASYVEKAGYAGWSARIIHSDWHPGNLLFRNANVVAVIDYDTLRLSRRLLDVGNGVLQFSMISGDEPATWPDDLDENRFSAFLKGYSSCLPLTASDVEAIPALMIEALIAECVAPIARTGSVGRWSGYRVMRMVRRKVNWLQREGKRLVRECGI